MHKDSLLKYCTSNFSGEKVRVTLWGELAHYISEDLTENQTVIIVTSTMVESFKFQGNSKVYKFNCVITILPINQSNICVV